MLKRKKLLCVRESERFSLEKLTKILYIFCGTTLLFQHKTLREGEDVNTRELHEFLELQKKEVLSVIFAAWSGRSGAFDKAGLRERKQLEEFLVVFFFLWGDCTTVQHLEVDESQLKGIALETWRT